MHSIVSSKWKRRRSFACISIQKEQKIKETTKMPLKEENEKKYKSKKKKEKVDGAKGKRTMKAFCASLKLIYYCITRRIYLSSRMKGRKKYNAMFR